MLSQDCQASVSPVASLYGNVWRLVAPQAKSLVALNDVAEGQPVYFVHSVSGSLDGYAELAALLGRRNPVFGLQLSKARMKDRALGGSIENLARHHVETLQAFQPKGAIVLGGFSAGAIIALEMAQQLQRSGREVALLIAIDGAPNNTGGGLRPWSSSYLARLLRNVPSWLTHEAATDLSGGRLIKRLFYRSFKRRHPTLPSGASARTLYERAVLQLVARAGLSATEISFIRALYDAMASYSPATYRAPVVVYEAKTQPLLRLRQIAAGWQMIAAKCDVLTLPGRHVSLLEAPAIYVMADHLRTMLRRVDETPLIIGDITLHNADVAASDEIVFASQPEAEAGAPVEAAPDRSASG